MIRTRVFLLLSLTPMLAAETQHGKVTWSGRAVPGAIITAVRGDRKVITTSEDSGAYQLEGLDAGEWKIEVQMFGFKTADRVVNVGGQASIDWTLELKPKPAVAAAASGRGGGSRAGYQAVAQRRAVEGQLQNAMNESRSEPEAPAASGSNVNESFLINGSTSQGFDRANSSQVNMVYGWGDNSAGSGLGRTVFGNRRGISGGGLRGALLWTLRDSALDARPYSLTGQQVPKPNYGQNRFSAMVGGVMPKLLMKQRGTWFLSYTATRGENRYQSFATVPGPLERSGDFSRSVIRGAVSIFDPLTGQPFAGNQIPASRIRPAAAGLLPYIPQPNQPGQVQNYQFVTAVPQNSHSGRIFTNIRLPNNDPVYITQNISQNESEQSQVYGYRDSASGYNYRASVMWQHGFNSHTNQGLRMDFSRGRNDVRPYFAGKRDVARELGILGTAGDPPNYGPPTLSFTNFGALTDASPVVRRDQSMSIGYGFYYNWKQHSISAGIEYYRTQMNNRTDENGRGTFNFTGLLTSRFDAQGLPVAATGFDLADLLLGLPQTSSVRFGASNTYFRANSSAYYLTDEIQAAKNLTFSLGVRYEIYGAFREKYGKIANLDVAPGFTGVAVVTPGQNGSYTGRFPAALIDSDKNNLSPRLGAAWKPFPKRGLRLRIGYGIYYNGTVYAPAALLLASQPPFANTGILNTSTAQPLRIEDAFVVAAQQGSGHVHNTYAVDRGYAVGYAQIWNVVVTQTLPHALLLEGGYVGTKGTHLDIQRLTNRAEPGSPLTAEQRRKIASAEGFTFDSSEGNSILHSGQLRVVRRFQKGMSFNAVYTYSKSIDNASTFTGGTAIVAQDDRNLRAERGVSSFDQRHALSSFYMVNSPVGGQGAPIILDNLAGRILRNWVFLGGITASSGSPLTARVLGNVADTGGTGSVGSGRADATGLPLDSGSGFFNLGAFQVPPSTRFGNAGRNTIITPSRLVMNLAIGRTFRINDRKAVELRVDSNNFINDVAITGFGTVINASNYGVASAAAPMRTISTSLRFRF